jgi:cholesterol oxidase
MERISSRPGELRQQYEVVVVGSGYGGSIIANRLARAGRDVCLLERGAEMLPGEFPDGMVGAAKDFQVHLKEHDLGSRQGLYELHVDEDINVFKGCGLGGTSLVNANVAIHPKEAIFADERWPSAIRADYDGLMAGMARAKEMLGSRPFPADRPLPAKTQVLQRMAGALGHPFHLTSINVTFEDGVNQAGVHQPACTGCGDCVSGCNVGAKNTLLMNYLPDARRWGASIFTGVDVRWVERSGDVWAVRFHELGAGRDRFGEDPMTVCGKIVVLAGGALGSTEILLRSKAKGLAVSPRVGTAFSGNGDVLGFAFDCDETVNGIGYGHDHTDHHREPVGPCITGVIDGREGADLEDGIIIEEGSIPGALAHAMPLGFALAPKDPDDGGTFLTRLRQAAQSLLEGPYHGPLSRTQTFLVMGNEPTSGTMDLEDDRLRIRWAGIGGSPLFARINQTLEDAATAVHGTYIPNPEWHEVQKNPLVTVHPLGGCPMGDTAEDGAVDHLGTVFRGVTGSDVHEGLHVCDGAVIPRPLGVNPLLTISAIAERTAAGIAARHGWTIDYDGEPPAAAPAATGSGLLVEFTERMAGWVAKGAASFEEGAAQGMLDGSGCSFELSMSGDAEAIVRDPSTRTNAVGVATCSALSPDIFAVEGGSMYLFVPDGDGSGNSEMRYEVPLRSTDGRAFHLSGHKEIDKGEPWDLWHDTTTLFARILEGGPDGPEWGRGILTIRPLDFAKQMTTMRVSGAAPLATRLKALSEYGEMFFGKLYSYYAGPLGWWRLRDKDVER